MAELNAAEAYYMSANKWYGPKSTDNNNKMLVTFAHNPNDVPFHLFHWQKFRIKAFFTAGNPNQTADTVDFPELLRDRASDRNLLDYVWPWDEHLQKDQNDIHVMEATLRRWATKHAVDWAEKVAVGVFDKNECINRDPRVIASGHAATAPETSQRDVSGQGTASQEDSLQQASCGDRPGSSQTARSSIADRHQQLTAGSSAGSLQTYPLGSVSQPQVSRPGTTDGPPSPNAPRSSNTRWTPQQVATQSYWTDERQAVPQDTSQTAQTYHELAPPHHTSTSNGSCQNIANPRQPECQTPSPSQPQFSLRQQQVGQPLEPAQNQLPHSQDHRQPDQYEQSAPHQQAGFQQAFLRGQEAETRIPHFQSSSSSSSGQPMTPQHSHVQAQQSHVPATQDCSQKYVDPGQLLPSALPQPPAHQQPQNAMRPALHVQQTHLPPAPPPPQPPAHQQPDGSQYQHPYFLPHTTMTPSAQVQQNSMPHRQSVEPRAQVTQNFPTSSPGHHQRIPVPHQHPASSPTPARYRQSPPLYPSSSTSTSSLGPAPRPLDSASPTYRQAPTARQRETAQQSARQVVISDLMHAFAGFDFNGGGGGTGVPRER